MHDMPFFTAMPEECRNCSLEIDADPFKSAKSVDRAMSLLNVSMAFAAWSIKG
jgi:hypothetical protein